jgi:cell division protein FtsQ
MTVVESAQRFGEKARTRRTVRWVALCLVVAVAGAGVWAVWFSSLFTVTEVRVLGARTVSLDEVRQVAAVPDRQPLARIDADGVAARVGAIPEVASVEVRRGWPHVLVIVVTERTPIAVTRVGTAWTYLDASAARFGTPAAPPRGMPVVTASTDVARAAAVGVVAALPTSLGSIVTLVSARSRDDVVLTLSGGSTVQWGSVDDSARKAAVLSSLLKVKARSYDVSAPDLPTTQGTSPRPSAS